VRKSKKSFVYNAMWLWMVVIGFVNRNYDHIVVCRRPDTTREERSAPPKSLGELRHCAQGLAGALLHSSRAFAWLGLRLRRAVTWLALACTTAYALVSSMPGRFVGGHHGARGCLGSVAKPR